LKYLNRPVNHFAEWHPAGTWIVLGKIERKDKRSI